MVHLLSGIIFDIKKYSIHDGPGIRTTVFFKGCPLSCWWCHNPESQSSNFELIRKPNRCIGCGLCLEACQCGALTANGINRKKCIACGKCAEACPAEALEIAGRTMTVSEIMHEVVKDVPFYEETGGGVTFSGGEPLAQPDLLRALLSECRNKGIHTAVDTSGYAPLSILESVAPQVDLFLYDLKHINNTKHRKLTGVDNKLILDNLRFLASIGQEIVIRIPILPGLNDDKENLSATCEFLLSLPQQYPVHLLPYHSIGQDKYARLDRAYRLPELKEPKPDHMSHCADIFRAKNFTVTIGG